MEWVPLIKWETIDLYTYLSSQLINESNCFKTLVVGTPLISIFVKSKISFL